MHKLDDNLDTERGPEPEIEIYTLGRFLIRWRGTVISESASRASKTWLLLKYLLTTRERPSSPETVLDTLWPGQHYPNPKQQLRLMIHRLRHLLAVELSAPELALNIVFAHGCYRWSETTRCRLDVDEFEKYIAAAEVLEAIEPGAAIELLKKAKRLYVGNYLPECSGSEWVLPVCNYYHQIFLKGMLLLAELLKRELLFAPLAELCRSVMELEYYEEKIHLYYLEALLEEGKSLQASIHYETVTAAFYREMGVKPSAALRRLYGRIRFENGNSMQYDLALVEESMTEAARVTGAFECDLELFRHIYQIERRRLERSGQSICLGLITLTGPDYQQLPREKLQIAMGLLRETISGGLRKGDLFCRFHEAQFVVLLPGPGRSAAKKVLSRLEKLFRQGCSLPGLVLHKRCQKLIHTGSISSLSPHRIRSLSSDTDSSSCK